ncbi:MAG TPA: TIGR02206 family membrane protein [Tepidisphaeraceae bacterium]
MHHFKPYTATHLFVVLSFVIFVLSMVATRRCDAVADVQPHRRLMDKIIGWVGLGAALFVQTAALWPSRFDYQTALPLHICDIVMFVAPLALLLRWRLFRSIAYFWGLGLSSLSFIYPDLQFGPGDFQFWVFWAGHATIVGTALYDITARGFRPNWRDWRLAVGWSLIYVAIIFPIDAIFRLDYGYIGKGINGRQPLSSFLGPWPWRVGLMVVMGITVMFLLLLPWLIGRKVGEMQTADKPPDQGTAPGGTSPDAALLTRVP